MTPHTHSSDRLAHRGRQWLLALAGGCLLWTCALAKPAESDQAYRCIGASGLVNYSQFACDARPELLTVRDDRHPAQIKQANALIARDVKLAKAMQRQRWREEKRTAAVPAKALTIPARQHVAAHATSTSASKASAKQAKVTTLKRHKPFTAMVPKTPQVTSR